MQLNILSRKSIKTYFKLITLSCLLGISFNSYSNELKCSGIFSRKYLENSKKDDLFTIKEVDNALAMLQDIYKQIDRRNFRQKIVALNYPPETQELIQQNKELFVSLVLANPALADFFQKLTIETNQTLEKSEEQKKFPGQYKNYSSEKWLYTIYSMSDPTHPNIFYKEPLIDGEEKMKEFLKKMLLAPKPFRERIYLMGIWILDANWALERLNQAFKSFKIEQLAGNQININDLHTDPQSSKTTFTGFIKLNSDLKYSALFSNEMKYSVFKETIQSVKPNQGYVGLGIEQNYTLMGMNHFKKAWLYDIDPNVIQIHLINRAFFLAMKNPTEFLSLYHEKSTNTAKYLLIKNYGTEEGKKLFQFYEENREIFLENYTKISNFKETTFLNDLAVFQNVHNLFNENRVHIIHADHTQDPLMSQIAQEAAQQNIKISVYYISNALSPNYGISSKVFQKNILELPITSDSVTLTTWTNGLEYFGIPRAHDQFPGYKVVLENFDAGIFMGSWDFTVVSTQLLKDAVEPK